MKWSSAAASLVLVASESQCYSSRGCGDEPPKLARDEDCLAFEARCLQELNASSSHDLVPLEEVMNLLEVVGQEKLHLGALRGNDWMDRFAAKYCNSREILDFPKDAQAVDALRKKLFASPAILVHSDELQDGIGARFKKALELAVASLLLGFDAVALNLPPAGGLLHPEPGNWKHGPVWCHESPADGPEHQVPGAPEYPLRCWRFDLQSDFLAQSWEPEGRQLLWGATSSSSSLRRCFTFQGDLEGPPWQFLSALPNERLAPQRLFDSARRFATPWRVLPGRREVKCGYGATESSSIQQHIAMHIRRGDVGDVSGYALTQQLDPSKLSRWLCTLARLLLGRGGAGAVALHVFTEAPGSSRSSLRRQGLPGFVFDEESHDAETIFHTMAKLAAPPACEELHPEVHVVVNNNPREALLCMARADVLITSLSSLSWSAAVLNPGLVLHPSPARKASPKVHWDLRDQYLDWADNWFPATDIWDPPQALRQFLSKET